MTTKYMHLIDGKPAFYTAFQKQICYWNFYGPAPEMASSLRQIRSEQKASEAYREERGLVDDAVSQYSYIRVKV